VIVNCPGRISDAPYQRTFECARRIPAVPGHCLDQLQSLILILHRHFRCKDRQSENGTIRYLVTLLGKIDALQTRSRTEDLLNLSSRPFVDFGRLNASSPVRKSLVEIFLQTEVIARPFDREVVTSLGE